MIISASRRTDIPAFFGDWFRQRIEDGYFTSINPFNPAQQKRVSLKKADVDLFVFWTKYPAPFMDVLSMLDEEGFLYYFQYTLNNYPELFEPFLPTLEKRIEAFTELSRTIGKERMIWRYDPIILSSVTPAMYHIEKFQYIAESLRGHTDRVMISAATFYEKVKRRFNELTLKNSVVFHDLLCDEMEEELIFIASALRDIASENDMEIFSCASPKDLSFLGIKSGACIDKNIVASLTGSTKSFRRDSSQRKECNCIQSTDMGVYNTCSYQCRYCYANYSDAAIAKNLMKHSVAGTSLI